MTDSWTVANLKDDIGLQAGKLAGLITRDDVDGLSDADMRKAYREGVEAVRAALKALT